MSSMIMIVALLLKIIGFGFLFSASLGLLRFKDPLQRMHASTKAGTIGAGLTVAGVALGNGEGYTLVIAALTIIFLIFSIPLAGHLLARAIYFSGASLLGLDQRDALREKIAARERESDSGSSEIDGK